MYKNKSFVHLACPVCKGDLEQIGDDQIKCIGACQNLYGIEDGIPILLPEDLEAFKWLEADYHSKESVNFTELNMKHSYRVVYYHEKYLKSFDYLKKGAIVIEVGGGDGLDAYELLKKEFVVIQSDISVGMVKVARNNTVLLSQGSQEHFVVCDAEQLPFKDRSLDAIMIVAALHHLPSPQRFFDATKKALKPGGLLVIGFEPNRWPYFTVYPILRFISKVTRLRQNFRHSETSIGDMETEGFVKADFQKFINDAGLEMIDLQRIWYLNGFVHTILTSLNSKISKEVVIDLPYWVQKVLVGFDEFLSKIPLLRDFCWHWTIVAKRPND